MRPRCFVKWGPLFSNNASTTAISPLESSISLYSCHVALSRWLDSVRGVGPGAYDTWRASIFPRENGAVRTAVSVYIDYRRRRKKGREREGEKKEEEKDRVFARSPPIPFQTLGPFVSDPRLFGFLRAICAHLRRLRPPRRRSPPQIARIEGRWGDLGRDPRVLEILLGSSHDPSLLWGKGCSIESDLSGERVESTARSRGRDGGCEAVDFFAIWQRRRYGGPIRGSLQGFALVAYDLWILLPCRCHFLMNVRLMMYRASLNWMRAR